MAGSRLSTLCRHVTATLADEAADAELLARFAAHRDEAAFAALVRRHGPMVWAVCRNLLPNAADADDAFQATFLALVRGAKGVRNPDALGGWLHGVAVRVAHKLRRTAARRTLREKKAAIGEAVRPVADSRWDEILAAVHEEVAKLPDGERMAFIVCCLEGVRQPDAAARLGWKPGTLSGRLSKAKQRLLDRLTRRGLAPAAALGALGLGATTGQALIPAKLLDAVLTFAGPSAVPTASVLQLSQGVLDMTITKVKLLAAAVLVAGGLATGFGASFFANADAQAPPPPVPPTPAAPPGLPPPVALPPAGVPGAPGVTPIASKVAPAQPLAGVGARRPAATVWEYKSLFQKSYPGDLDKVLNAAGADGWELVTASPSAAQWDADSTPTPGTVYVFKRAKPVVVTTGGPPGQYPTFGDLPDAVGKARGGPALVAPIPTTDPNVFMPPPAPTVKAVTLHTIPLTGGNSTQMAKVLKELLAANEFAGEVTAVIADEASNSLLVKATANGKKLVEKQVKELEQFAAEREKRDKRRETPTLPSRP